MSCSLSLLLPTHFALGLMLMKLLSKWDRRGCGKAQSFRWDLEYGFMAFKLMINSAMRLVISRGLL